MNGTLVDPLTARVGHILIARGASVQLSVVKVTKSSRIQGRDTIELKVDSITFRGQKYPCSDHYI